MTWTVTGKGINAASYTSTAVTSVALTGLTGIAAGDSIIEYGTYSSFGPFPTGTDSVPNTYTFVDNVNESTAGQAFCYLESFNISAGPTSVTLQFPSQPFVGVGVLQVHNSVAGAPTLHAHTTIDNTASATTGASAATAATNGDLVIAFLGIPFLGTPTGVTMTGVTTPTIANSNSATGMAIAYGVTTTNGNVTATFSGFSTSGPSAIFVMTLTPPTGAAACPKTLPLLGVGCAIAARKLEENPIITRRGLMIPNYRR